MSKTRINLTRLLSFLLVYGNIACESYNKDGEESSGEFTQRCSTLQQCANANLADVEENYDTPSTTPSSQVEGSADDAELKEQQELTDESQVTETNTKKVEEPEEVIEAEPNLLLHLAQNIVLKNLQQFAIRLQGLNEDTMAYCAAPDNEILEAAQKSWRQTMFLWQKLEAAKFGPLSKDFSDLASQALQIYSLELYASPYHLSRAVSQFSTEAGLDTSRTNTLGLDAIEVLLFGTDNVQSCSQNYTKLFKPYDALSETEKNLAKCQYMTELFRHLESNTFDLLYIWINSYLPGLEQLVENQKLKEQDKILQDIFHSMFYLDSSVKDKKLGEPIGNIETSACSRPPCACRVEHPYSRSSIYSILANLESFEQLFFGNSLDQAAKIGFDDRIKDSGREDLNQKIENGILAAKIKAQSIAENTSMFESIASWGDEDCKDASEGKVLCKLYQSIKSVTDLLKGTEDNREFEQALKLELPQRAGGEND